MGGSWDIKIKSFGWQYYFREDHLHSSFELFCNPFPPINFAAVAFDDIELTLNVSCISESFIEIKIKLNFYFYTFLWYLKRFYEGL